MSSSAPTTSSDDDHSSSVSPIPVNSPVNENEAKRRSPRRSNTMPTFTCAVPKCGNTDKSTYLDGRPLRFFDLPSKKAVNAQWIKSVPELELAKTPSQKKVCAYHFVDGAPSTQHPSPTLCLMKDVDSAEQDSNRTSNSPDCIELGDSPTPPDAPEEPTFKKASVILTTDRDQPISLPTFPNSKAPSINRPATRIIRIGPGGINTVNKNTIISTKPSENRQWFQNMKTSDGKVLRVQRVSMDNSNSGLRNVMGSIPESVSRAAATITPKTTTSGESSGSPMTLFSALEQVRALPVKTSPTGVNCNSSAVDLFKKRIGDLPETTCSNNSNGSCEEESCKSCIASLPVLRRSLGKLETQMNMINQMVKVMTTHFVSQKNTNVSAPPSVAPPITQTMRTVAIGDKRPLPSGFTSQGTRFAPLANKMRKVQVGYSIGTPKSKAPPSAASVKFTSLQNSKKAIARTILLFPAATFSVEELQETRPALFEKEGVEMVGDTLRSLTRTGYLKRTDGDMTIDYSDKDAIYEKEVGLIKSEPKLLFYDVTLQQFMNSLV